MREMLDSLRTQGVVVLHERRIRGTNVRIPHLVVASSGVWVIGTEPGGGRVEKVSVRRWLRRDERLCLDGVDRTDLLADVVRQVDAVGLALVRDDYDGLPLHRALALLDADWPVEAAPFSVCDVLVASPTALVAMIRQRGSVTTTSISAVGELLGRAFPAS
jgi:hypothetical protein